MSNTKISPSENNLGKRLRIARKLLKLTQQQFAKNVGISGAYVSDIEKGKAEPSETVLKSICLEHRISREWLVSGEGVMLMPAVVSEPETDYSPDLIEGMNLLKENPYWAEKAAEVYKLPTKAQQDAVWEALRKALKAVKVE